MYVYGCDGGPPCPLVPDSDDFQEDHSNNVLFRITPTIGLARWIYTARLSALDDEFEVVERGWGSREGYKGEPGSFVISFLIPEYTSGSTGTLTVQMWSADEGGDSQLIACGKVAFVVK